MSILHGDIDDDEIRVISSENKASESVECNDETVISCDCRKSDPIKSRRFDDTIISCCINASEPDECSDNDFIPCRSEVPAPAKRWKIVGIICIVVSLLLIGIFAIIFFSVGESEDEVFKEMPERSDVIAQTTIETYSVPVENITTPKPYTMRTDTVVGGIALSILTPVNATPVLEIGSAVPFDSTAVLAVQAADVRKDNGGIVGSFVVKGDLVSKGEAKAGFCSIINGDVTVGVADATPMFEQALSNDGYFFRQYPLVVGGQLVENKPKGASVRRALAEINGRICVVVSQNKLTFHDFSQALIDAGTSNAIYLVGGDACGSFVDSSGKSFTFGKAWDKDIDNVNYIVWR